MIFRQITHDDLGCASYLIGDKGAGVAAVVDPRLEIDEYLRLAAYYGVSIEHILETHNHADHVSGHGRLQAATGAAIHIHREAEPDYDHLPFDDGWELELGSVVLRALHTPGHRPEHTAIVLIDSSRGPEPWAILTGDSLFVGDVARPDLAIEKSEGARGIFRSIHEKLLELPDSCEVWPGHLGGSMCGGPGMDMKTSSTIGFEKAHNPSLEIADEDEFVESALSGLGPQPPNFEQIVTMNRGPLVTDRVEIAPLTATQVDEQRRNDAMIVDVRTDIQFDEAHIPGAISIPAMKPGFGTKLAWLADHEQPVLLVGRDDREAVAASRLSEAIGVRDLGGYLHGGMTSWRQERRPVERISRLPVPDLAADLREHPETQVLDVREESEWEEGHLEGSVHMPWHDIESVPSEIAPDRRLAVICGSGERSGIAASLLARHGASDVIHVVDGGVKDAFQVVGSAVPAADRA